MSNEVVCEHKLHPGRLTWNLQITHLERKMIFQTSMIMFHVNLQGCRYMFICICLYVYIHVLLIYYIYIYVLIDTAVKWPDRPYLDFGRID